MERTVVNSVHKIHIRVKPLEHASLQNLRRKSKFLRGWIRKMTNQSPSGISSKPKHYIHDKKLSSKGITQLAPSDGTP
jgi:hypothetical protein